MQHDVAPGAYTKFLGGGHVFRVRIGYVEGLVKAASRVSSVQDIQTLWGSMVPLTNLRADRLTAESDLVGPNFLPLREQHQLALLLVDYHPVDMNGSVRAIRFKPETSSRAAISIRMC